jgi:hypothetical protein
LRSKAQSWRSDAHGVLQRLLRVQRDFGIDPDAARRTRTARAAESLLERIVNAEPEKVIEALATGAVDTSEGAVGLSLGRGAALVSALDSTAWDLFNAVGRLTDERAVAGQGLRQRIAEALEADELAVNLASTLKGAQSDAVRLLAGTPSPPAVTPPRPAGWREVQARTRVAPRDAIAELESYVRTVDRGRLERLAVSWRVEEKE